MRDLQTVILAAGLGTRLGRPFPKPLTPLISGQTIMERQVASLRTAFGEDLRIMFVVGFKMNLIMEAFPDGMYVYNEVYDQTNTSKSLLKALRLSADQSDVLWLNGDVVFDGQLLETVKPLIAAERSFVCVNTAQVGAEEIKYTVNGHGHISELSKWVIEPLGEAIGINFVTAQDKATLVKHLDRCEEQDYFERGLETAIAEDGLRLHPVDISRHFAVEVDFEADLDRANQAL
ncbi:MAG: NTP transferase domain-containing protein [Sporichthyaceae bacterium]|nr:NTP transferase domain-containing protein [Sporichthyaceae bacterium]